MDEKQRQQFDIEINRPLPGEEPVSGPWSDEAMGSAFASLQGQLGGSRK